MPLSIAFIICCRLSIYICFVDIAVAAKREFVVRAIVAFDDLHGRKSQGVQQLYRELHYACVERHGGVEKASDSMERSAHCRCRSPEKHLMGYGSSRGNSATGDVGEKMEENSLGARRRGARCYNEGDFESGSASGSVHMGNVG